MSQQTLWHTACRPHASVAPRPASSASSSPSGLVSIAIVFLNSTDTASFSHELRNEQTQNLPLTDAALDASGRWTGTPNLLLCADVQWPHTATCNFKQLVLTPGSGCWHQW